MNETELKPKNILYPEKVKLPSLESIKSSTTIEKIGPYLNDESNIIKGNAERVFFPKTSEEVAKIVQEASKKNIQVTVSGAGTGLTGSRVALKGWIIATDYLRNVNSYDKEKSVIWKDPETNIEYSINILNTKEPSIRVPVSMRLKSIQAFVKSIGYFYPPDPTERNSFIGGNVATNASGSRTFKYGSTRAYVQGLKVVLTNGLILQLTKEQKCDDNYTWIIASTEQIQVFVEKSNIKKINVSKNAIGVETYKNMPLYEIFIGTEGIFGIITEILLKVIPEPKNIFSMIIYFSSKKEALDFVVFAKNQKQIMHEPIPLSVEFFDENALQLISNKYAKKIPENTIAAVYLEQDVDNKEKIDEYLEYWLNYLEKIDYIDSWAEIDSKGIEEHKAFRHALPTEVHSTVKKNNTEKVGTDFAVPPENFPNFLELHKKYEHQFRMYQQAKKPLQTGEVGVVTYGHIGNDHLHMNFLPRDKDELSKAKELYLEMMKEVVRMGGTVSAEHGVGKKRFGGKPYIYYQLGDEGIETLRKLKKILDPANILNRGNLFD